MQIIVTDGWDILEGTMYYVNLFKCSAWISSSVCLYCPLSLFKACGLQLSCSTLPCVTSHPHYARLIHLNHNEGSAVSAEIFRTEAVCRVTLLHIEQLFYHSMIPLLRLMLIALWAFIHVLSSSARCLLCCVTSCIDA